jgi:hypothetical protein
MTCSERVLTLCSPHMAAWPFVTPYLQVCSRFQSSCKAEILHVHWNQIWDFNVVMRTLRLWFSGIWRCADCTNLHRSTYQVLLFVLEVDYKKQNTQCLRKIYFYANTEWSVTNYVKVKNYSWYFNGTLYKGGRCNGTRGGNLVHLIMASLAFIAQTIQSSDHAVTFPENIGSLLPEIWNVSCTLRVHLAFNVTSNRISDVVRSAELWILVLQ